MKFYLLLFLLVSMVIFPMSGCSESSSSSEHSGSDVTGTASIQVQWPDEKSTADAAADTDGGIKRLVSGSNERSIQADLSNECEDRGVVTVSVEVRDNQEEFLASETFDCELGEGVIEGIPVGSDRHFIVSGLDEDGKERYHGEKSGVVIETGFNEVGVIEMADITSSPIAVISEPPDNGLYTIGEGITFTGSASDGEDGDLTGSALVWSSDINGQFGTGASVTFSDFSPGTHTISLTATDSDGKTGSATISITINSLPSATIIRPFDGSQHSNNDNIYFEGAATDSEDGQITSQSSLTWTSDIDGAIGSGVSFVATGLTAGVHEITLTVTDSYGGTGTDSVSITVIVPKLPDTGQAKCYDNKGEIPCPSSGKPFYGQDASYTINPPSYTKLDENGMELSDNAVSWALVGDNVTGLVWEVKTTDGSINNHTDTYTWADAKGEFVNRLNETGFGGFSDWRLPSIMEFYTIINADSYDPAVNTEYFPNIPETEEPWYWSATLKAPSLEWPWVIDFKWGDAAGYEGTTYYVRAVRGPELNFGRFVDNGDGTVTDTSTGLMWQQGATQTERTWEEALVYCEALKLGGYSDWRLPNRHELHTLVAYDQYNPSIDTTVFDLPDSNYTPRYWSSTTTANYTGAAYGVSFYSGYGSSYTKQEQLLYVRAVRGGE